MTTSSFCSSSCCSCCCSWCCSWCWSCCCSCCCQGPECYGLHDNAAITSSILETSKLLSNALSLLPRSTAAGAKTWGEMLAETAGIVEGQLPGLFDLEKISIQYPTLYEDSSNTILTQELERYNKLLNRVKISLRDVQRALKGEVVMSTELETMGNSIVNGKVPGKQRERERERERRRLKDYLECNSAL